MIINLLALLVILATGAVAGDLLTVRYAEHRHAQLRREPSAFEPRDRLSI
jgi:hypothetical protein